VTRPKSANFLQVTKGFEEPMEKRRRLDVVNVDYGHGIDFQVKKIFGTTGRPALFAVRVFVDCYLIPGFFP